MRYCILLILTLLSPPPDSVLVAFWNMENFFDPFVDTTRVYNDFTADGAQHWTSSRFYRKRNNLYKAILAFSGGQPLGIMGVCEVENDFVLNALFGQTPLKQYNYRWVHYDGPDRRGIDPAIVYSKDLFQLIYSEAIPYHNPEEVILTVQELENEFMPRVRFSKREIKRNEMTLVDGHYVLKGEEFADDMKGWAIVRVVGDSCSSQTIVTNCTLYQQYTTREAQERAADSYGGLTETPFLSPR